MWEKAEARVTPRWGTYVTVGLTSGNIKRRNKFGKSRWVSMWNNLNLSRLILLSCKRWPVCILQKTGSLLRAGTVGSKSSIISHRTPINICSNNKKIKSMKLSYPKIIREQWSPSLLCGPDDYVCQMFRKILRCLLERMSSVSRGGSIEAVLVIFIWKERSTPSGRKGLSKGTPAPYLTGEYHL